MGKTCRNCAMDIPVAAKLCPYCKSIVEGWAMFWLWVGVLVLASPCIITCGGCLHLANP